MAKTNNPCCWCTDLRTRLIEARDMELCPNPECEVHKKKENGVANEPVKKLHISRINQNEY